MKEDELSETRYKQIARSNSARISSAFEISIKSYEQGTKTIGRKSRPLSSRIIQRPCHPPPTRPPTDPPPPPPIINKPPPPPPPPMKPKKPRHQVTYFN